MAPYMSMLNTAYPVGQDTTLTLQRKLVCCVRAVCRVVLLAIVQLTAWSATKTISLTPQTINV